ncbi:uncharacterized protein MYCFIDRAFT_193316 [Pseudocercospora fijiensis CIRAD86]|uniref:Uncharacterized protein n=1 Tax=Pseudocercospora fijiensis (strain CIRAD86) TaxID=383855 RepID=N1QCW1_PSEFD|nr:uncharacterized protein MYCFIDRAFT_193316 [Pseudocercospora fijiensis CIRAD86]EME89393.1 hypothetical protein MYCFIDRAFT_193316 [Pseudocercospora fijiensis CIRAD86]
MPAEPISVVPGHSVGSMSLGASLHSILTAVKEDKTRYPKIDLSISQSSPLKTPIVLSLPENGLRLRFDGSDQRLRLIEVLDFQRAGLVYKGSDLTKDGLATFKRIYQLFGASYPGEYMPPSTGKAGIYTLSWPGIAFNFPLQHSAYAPEKDHVSLLGSHAASPATNMALFEGNTWPDARLTLFTKAPTAFRTSAITSQPRDNLPPEIDHVSIHDAGKVLLVRTPPAPPVHIVLGQTTPQDLLTELGPPDTTHKREIQNAMDQPTHPRPRSTSRSISNGRHHPTPPSSYSSTGTDTFDTDFDSGDAEDDAAERMSREVFWCYFTHGMDILLGPQSEPTSFAKESLPVTPLSGSQHLVVLKVIIHGNVPGSYAFNRHRRLRWQLHLSNTTASPSSEHNFDEIKPDLIQAFQVIWPGSEMGRGKVINRTWGANPSDSSFFLPDAEQDLVEGGGSEQWLGNTKLYQFPGLTFEVLGNGAISALTVS